MPSFADLKEKAVKAKDASIEKIQQTKDRNTSIPLKKTNWNPYGGEPAPAPPPPRVSANTRPTLAFPPPPPPPNRTGMPPPPTRTPSIIKPSSSPISPPTPPSLQQPALAPPRLPARTLSTGPPPIQRSTRPNTAFPPSRVQPEPEIDWSNLTAEDKQVFFSWLDEFFGKFYNIEIPFKNATSYR